MYFLFIIYIIFIWSFFASWLCICKNSLHKNVNIIRYLHSISYSVCMRCLCVRARLNCGRNNGRWDNCISFFLCCRWRQWVPTKVPHSLGEKINRKRKNLALFLIKKKKRHPKIACMLMLMLNKQNSIQCMIKTEENDAKQILKQINFLCILFRTKTMDMTTENFNKKRNKKQFRATQNDYQLKNVAVAVHLSESVRPPIMAVAGFLLFSYHTKKVNRTDSGINWILRKNIKLK